MADDERPSIAAMMTDRLGRVGIRSGQILLIVILVSAIVYGLVQLKLVVIPLLIAVILAAALSPVVDWMRRHGFPSILATWITFLVGMIVLGGVVTLMVFAVQNQWAQLAKSAGDGLNQLQDYLLQANIPIDKQQIQQAQQSVGDFITSTQFGTGALAGLSIATQLITGFLLTVVILFFFLKDGGEIWSFFLRPFHGARRERGVRIGHTALAVLGGYVRGTAIVALVDAVAIGSSLFVLRIPLALPLTVFVFITAFIPMIGATVAGVVAALVALVTNGPVVALVVAGIVVLVNQLEGDLLQPLVMSQSVKLHPLVILVALTAGTILGGVAGAVLGVPLAAVGWAIVKTWNVPDDGL